MRGSRTAPTAGRPRRASALSSARYRGPDTNPPPAAPVTAPPAGASRGPPRSSRSPPRAGHDVRPVEVQPVHLPELPDGASAGVGGQYLLEGAADRRLQAVGAEHLLGTPEQRLVHLQGSLPDRVCIPHRHPHVYSTRG